jgi:formate/nitrite transporter FocA (FNT family)
VVLAALGQREQPGEPTVEEKRQARKQAMRVWIRSISAGIVMTVIVCWLIRRF